MSAIVDISRIEKWRALFTQALASNGEAVALREILTALKQAVLIADAHAAADQEFIDAFNTLLLTKRILGQLLGGRRGSQFEIR